MLLKEVGQPLLSAFAWHKQAELWPTLKDRPLEVAE